MNEFAKTGRAWQRVGQGPHHGICLPLWSLHSQNGCGIGDFGDLPKLFDWCKSIGFDCIQILPICDSGDDPSPYNALSSCALNPIYLDLRQLGGPRLDRSFSRLNYNHVKRFKLHWLFEHYAKTKASLEKLSEYQSFVNQQSSWLEPYVRFMAIKDEYGGKAWQDWPEEQRSLETCKAPAEGAGFHRFLQYHCHVQMRSVKELADQKGIFLMGDIPLLMSPDSVDVWANPTLFDRARSAGAPPDYYNPDGQRWGFPLPNRDEMRKDNFGWWRQRVRCAEQFFHLYRIDHFVGLFRLWSFYDGTSTQGAFVPEDKTLWQKNAEEILDAILKESDMLPMAEDLGIIPPMVEETLHRYGICGMAVIRWQKHWDTDGSFIPYEQYHSLNLTTVSTHDSEPLALWWKALPEEAARFAAFKHWTYGPTLSQWQRKEILRDSHHTPTHFHINLLQEYLALYPELVSPTLEEERINVPGTISPTNWTYCFKPSLEEIIAHNDLKKSIQDILLNHSAPNGEGKSPPY